MFQYSARPDLLKDRVILVTGAGRGIGAAAAKTFAAHGATVLLLGKTEEYLNEVYDAIEAAGHPQAAVIPFNLETAQPHQFEELAATLENEFGRIDGLLHNASILGPRSAMYAGTFQPLSGPLASTSSAKRVLSKFLPTTLSCNFSASSSGLLGARLSLRPTDRFASAWHQSAFSRPKASSSVRPQSCDVVAPTVTETLVW